MYILYIYSINIHIVYKTYDGLKKDNLCVYTKIYIDLSIYLPTWSHADNCPCGFRHPWQF